MSWVSTAIENAGKQGYQKLHQTVYGGYGTKPDVSPFARTTPSRTKTFIKTDHDVS